MRELASCFDMLAKGSGDDARRFAMARTKLHEAILWNTGMVP